METNNIFIIFGIIASFVVSVITLLITVKNRRNNLRELIYKEQIQFFARLFIELNELNTKLDDLLDEPTEENDFNDTIKKIELNLYNGEFLIPDNINSLAVNLITYSNSYYLLLLTGSSHEITKSRSIYYSKYYDFLKYVKEFIGTDKLSIENKNLHSKNELVNTKALRNILGEVAKSIIN